MPKPNYCPAWLWRVLPAWALVRIGFDHTDITDRRVKFILKSTGAWSVLENLSSRDPKGGDHVD